MKTVIIKRISFVNFKGFRELTIEFNREMTAILGRNGSGKTTVFDGFTWVLFGKDSKDRKSFDIKTLNAKGVAIPRLPHEVSVILECGGEEIRLTRRYCEKWQKKRGEAEETFTGHEEERLYNDVPCSVKEWNEKIAAICPEQVFKFITNPSYFASQKPDVQRAMLFDMAGNISDADLAADNPNFAALLASLTGKTMEEYKREIQAKKRRLKAEIEAIPERIDERKRDTPESTDFEAIERELADKKKALADIDAQLTDISEAQKKINERKREIDRKIGDLNTNLSQRQWKLKEEATAEYRKACADQSDLKYRIESLQKDIRRHSLYIDATEKELEAHAREREVLIAEWQSIKAETLTFAPDSFNCPTCGRPLDVADIEKKQSEMTERFNKRKAEKLEANVSHGKTLKQIVEDKQKLLAQAREALAKANADLEKLTSTTITVPTPVSEADLLTLYRDDAECIAIRKQIQDCHKELSDVEETAAPDSSELKEAKSILQGSIEELTKILAQKVLIERNRQRISELETQLRNQSQELAELEKTEFTIAQFSKARIEAVENRINSLFRIVRFKMFDQQINGGEIETCEAMVDGVPYSSLNNAMQVNAGLDIINAICHSKGISVPVFIDNAESVQELEPTISQQIRLVVSDEPTLTTSYAPKNLFSL